jgi:hypothetical protein
MLLQQGRCSSMSVMILFQVLRTVQDADTLQGILDDVFPIEDSYLALQHGSIKDARFLPGLKHLGEPFASPIIFEWMSSVFGQE